MNFNNPFFQNLKLISVQSGSFNLGDNPVKKVKTENNHENQSIYQLYENDNVPVDNTQSKYKNEFMKLTRDVMKDVPIYEPKYLTLLNISANNITDPEMAQFYSPYKLISEKHAIFKPGSLVRSEFQEIESVGSSFIVTNEEQESVPSFRNMQELELEAKVLANQISDGERRIRKRELQLMEISKVVEYASESYNNN